MEHKDKRRIADIVYGIRNLLKEAMTGAEMLEALADELTQYYYYVDEVDYSNLEELLSKVVDIQEGIAKVSKMVDEVKSDLKKW